MNTTFYKYQGTGNDFVMIDNRAQVFDKKNTSLVAHLCDRRFGIGADGLILLENHESYDFKMVYYNSDGNESSMCGNGGRCLVAFAQFLGVIENQATFEAVDGLHHAFVEEGLVKLQMQNVTKIEKSNAFTFLDTGSPHHVQLQSDLDQLDVKLEGAKIRYGEPYGSQGTNVNFVSQVSEDTFQVRTYERGVEDETLSCGTGVTAVAIAMHSLGHTQSHQVHLNVPGGNLLVTFEKEGEHYKNVWLIGPAEQVFKGEISW